jgi:hypothetical protein
MVQLHVVQELLQMLEGEEPKQVAPMTDSESETEELQALSEQAQKRTEGILTMRLKGKIQKYEVIVMIDSGSSTSFISR